MKGKTEWKGRLASWVLQAENTAAQLEEAKKVYEQSLLTQQLTKKELEALLPNLEQLEALRDEVQSYERQLEQLSLAKKRLQENKKAYEDVRIPMTQGEVEAAEQAYTAAIQRHTNIEWQAKQIKKALTDLAKLEQENIAQTEQFTFITRLYELANGGAQGIRGVTFERYVLGAILEEVVIAANERLYRLSRGRYSLQRADFSDGGRGHRGLDLAVYDSYTGAVRPANTLSGGETFLASLALALGLADIIQAYAGGIHLDTIFIDEGFGTLDPETLEVALQCLIDLQASGRLIGIISHVPELKQRIGAQLIVEKVAQGSRAYFSC